MIPLAQCGDRVLYRLQARNLRLGVFCAERKAFVGLREKFGARFAAEEFHWETGAPFGTARPVKAYPERLPEGIALREILPGAKCATCGVLVEYNGKDAWFHVAPTECTTVRPVTRRNAPLEAWLMRMAARYTMPV